MTDVRMRSPGRHFQAKPYKTCGKGRERQYESVAFVLLGGEQRTLSTQGITCWKASVALVTMAISLGWQLRSVAKAV